MKLAHDRWFAFDKAEHFCGGLLFYFLAHLIIANFPNWLLVIWGAIFAFGWEVKDTFVHPDMLPPAWKEFGGDGFSYKDLVWTVGGLLIAWFIWAVRF